MDWPHANVSAAIKMDAKSNGLPGLLAVLDGLAADMRATILLDAVKEGAKPVQREAKRLAPVDTGALRVAIKTKAKANRARGTAFAVVGPSTQSFVGRKAVKKGQSAAGANKPSRYAHNQEFGWVDKNGKRHPGKAFMRPAARVGERDSPGYIAAGIQKGLIKSVRKNKKNGNV